jgi:hypothetical protein
VTSIPGSLDYLERICLYKQFQVELYNAKQKGGGIHQTYQFDFQITAKLYCGAGPQMANRVYIELAQPSRSKCIGLRIYGAFESQLSACLAISLFPTSLR